MKEAQEQRLSRLTSLLVGERRPEEPEVRQWFAADPSLREEFEALQAIAAEVERDAARERELVAAAAAEPDDPDQAAFVARELARQAVRRPAGAPTPALTGLPARRRWGLGLLAAAALVATGYLVWRSPATHPGDDQRVLSGAPLGIDEPAPTAEGGLRLSWRASLPGAEFDASIYDPAHGRGKPLLERPDDEAKAATWTISKAAFDALPRGSRLLVVARWSGRSVDAEKIVR